MGPGPGSEVVSEVQTKNTQTPHQKSGGSVYMAAPKKSSTRRRPILVRHKSRPIAGSGSGSNSNSNPSPDTSSHSAFSEDWVDLPDDEDGEEETGTF